MTTVITAKIFFAEEHIEAVKHAAAIMMAASQAEDGCIDYAFAQDVSDPTLFRVIEVWEDDAALGRHFKMPHMAAFNEALAATPPISMVALHHTGCQTGPLNVAAFKDDA